MMIPVNFTIEIEIFTYTTLGMNLTPCDFHVKAITRYEKSNGKHYLGYLGYLKYTGGDELIRLYTVAHEEGKFSELIEKVKEAVLEVYPELDYI